MIPILLPNQLPLVKYISFFTIFLLSNPGICKMTSSAQTVILAIGQHWEIKVPQLSRYSVGNDNALSHKHLEKRNILLFKGRHIGFSEVVIWQRGKTKDPLRYHLYIVDKRHHLKIIHLLESIRGVGLTAKLSGPLIIVTGKVQSRNTHRLMNKLISQYPKDLHVLATFSSQYYHKLLGRIYKNFYDEYVEDFECYPEGLHIYCRYPVGAGPSKKLKAYLKKNCFAVFIPIEKKRTKNYRLKMKLIQMEKLDGKEIHFGLEKLDGTLKDLFEQGVIGFIKKNKFLINRYKIDVSTLAHPQTILRIGHPTEIKVGREIPYKASENKVMWKFAGLQLNFKLKESKKGLHLDFITKLTSPEEGSDNVVGNQESSSALIQPNQPIELFEITFKTIGTGKSAFPGLSKIPMLGTIFRSKSKSTNYKNITGIAVLEEI